MNKRVGKITALEKLQKYCAYQDRCHKEVRTKLIELGIYGEDLEEIIADLILDNFLNEERFARSYARGKFRIKGWGKMKIIRELKQRQISPYCIQKGLSEIDDEDYRSKLYNILKKKSERLLGDNEFSKRKKLFNYAFQKGYESFLIQSCLDDLTSQE